jgi:phosphoglycerate dehydrogenase-like enzyme
MLILCTQNLTPEEKDEIRRAAPEADVEAADSREEILRRAKDAEILFAGSFDEEIFNAAPRLKWVQVGSAGVEGYLFPALMKSDVLFTSSSGVFDQPIAEHLLAMMSAFARKLPLFRDFQREARWDRSPEPEELGGKTVGVAGLGAIGTALAKKARGLDMRVVGIKRTLPKEPIPGVDWVRTMDALPELMSESDHIVVTLPNTPATRGVINREAIRAMKPTAYLYNIGRGVTIDQDALIQALQRGEIAGAGLDVTSPEPLPPDSPLWRMPNVILTPHVSGLSKRTRSRQIAHFVENLKRYRSGEPLESLVDKEAGY